MPVIDTTHDVDARQLVITAQFAAPVDRVWQVYADPRQLERVFGPPTYPATFVLHEMTPGGRAHYYMTSPEGERHYGWWKFIEVEAPHQFSFQDGFSADDTFANQEGMPVSTNTYRFSAHQDGTRAVYTSTYESAEALQQVLDMGMIEGATLAINQIDDLVA